MLVVLSLEIILNHRLLDVLLEHKDLLSFTLVRLQPKDFLCKFVLCVATLFKTQTVFLLGLL